MLLHIRPLSTYAKFKTNVECSLAFTLVLFDGHLKEELIIEVNARRVPLDPYAFEYLVFSFLNGEASVSFVSSDHIKKSHMNIQQNF